MVPFCLPCLLWHHDFAVFKELEEKHNIMDRIFTMMEFNKDLISPMTQVYAIWCREAIEKDDLKEDISKYKEFFKVSELRKLEEMACEAKSKCKEEISKLFDLLEDMGLI